jgi:hypothetical protein
MITQSISRSQNEITRERTRRTKLLIATAALISFFLSISLWFTGSREQALFVGLWVPSICSAGTLLLAGGENG